MGFEGAASSTDELDALIDEMDGQVITLGRLFSARQGGDAQAAHPHGQGALGDLTMPQFSLLRAVSEGPVKMADIATRLGIKPPAVSAIVNAAERAGYITRDRDTDDRRVTRVVLTTAGHAALLKADGDRREMLRRHASVLSLDDLRALIRIQNVLIGAMVSKKL
jgi:DNA-binding MarR family transcriptional regulator